MDLYRSKYSDKKSKRNPRRGDEPHRSFRNSRNRDDENRESTTVTCADCGTECRVPFVPRTNKPVYCSDCFREKPRDGENMRYSGDRDNRRYSGDRGSRNSRDGYRNSRNRDDERRESTTVTCADCGTECQVPFVPRNNRPVYCSDCFREKPRGMDDSRNSRDGDRHSRDNDRHSRDTHSGRSRSGSGRFLKKQETRFSDGSEKFYASLREKLFDILGGKVCSNCGFKHEKALGFSHKYDDNLFDDIRRGGAASSWGKYISEPELAKEELAVLCLNCNEIRQPSDRAQPKQKKNRRFPR